MRLSTLFYDSCYCLVPTSSMGRVYTFISTAIATIIKRTPGLLSAAAASPLVQHARLLYGRRLSYRGREQAPNIRLWRADACESSYLCIVSDEFRLEDPFCTHALHHTRAQSCTVKMCMPVCTRVPVAAAGKWQMENGRRMAW